MSNQSLDFKQLQHDLKGLVEPVETVKILLESGKIEQAVRIQTSLLDALKKLVQGVEAVAIEKRGGES